MESDPESDNAAPAPETRALARKLMDAWTKPSVNENLQRVGEVDPGRRVFRMGNLTGGGMPYPGPRCGTVLVQEIGEEHEEDHRNASFNEASKA